MGRGANIRDGNAVKVKRMLWTVLESVSRFITGRFFFRICEKLEQAVKCEV